MTAATCVFQARRTPLSEGPQSQGCHNPMMDDSVSYAILRFPETGAPRAGYGGYWSLVPVIQGERGGETLLPCLPSCAKPVPVTTRHSWDHSRSVTTGPVSLDQQGVPRARLHDAFTRPFSLAAAVVLCAQETRRLPPRVEVQVLLLGRAHV